MKKRRWRRNRIAFFKEHGRLFQFGDYYRLTSPFENRDYTVWEYAAQDGSDGCMSVVYTDMYANAASGIVKWKGLDPKKVYDADRWRRRWKLLRRGVDACRNPASITRAKL